MNDSLEPLKVPILLERNLIVIAEVTDAIEDNKIKYNNVRVFFNSDFRKKKGSELKEKGVKRKRGQNCLDLLFNREIRSRCLD